MTEPKTDETSLTAPSEGGAVVTEEMANQFKLIDAAIHANVDQSELQISRLSIMQPLSPEIANQVPGYKQGYIVDNLNREVVTCKLRTPWLAGKVPDDELQAVDCVEFVPIFKLPTEFIQWKKRNTEGIGMHFKTLDVNDPRVRAGIFPPRGTFVSTKEQKSPPITENINILALLIDPETKQPTMMPVVITFAKTSFKEGKKLVTMCEGLRFKGLPFFASTFWLYTRKMQKDNNTYYVFTVARGDLVNKSAPKVAKLVLDYAAYLSDVNEGRSRQEATINAAAFDEEGGDSSVAGDDTSAPQTGEEPF